MLSITFPFRYSLRPNCNRGQGAEVRKGRREGEVTWISTSGAMSGIKRESKMFDLRSNSSDGGQNERERERGRGRKGDSH
jgi:hypothetical protein